MPQSVFAKYEPQAYPHRFAGQLVVSTIAGGIPSDENVAKSWIATKLGTDNEELLRKAVAETMVERGITMEQAADEVNTLKHLNGFKRVGNVLVIEGRQLKACLKEAVNVAANAGKITTKGWGNPDNANYKKGVKAWFPEHVFVEDDKMELGHMEDDGLVFPVTEPDQIVQRFVHTPRGTGIQYEETVTNAVISFTCETDYDFTDEQWAMIWLTAERQGLGASRSQGFGTFKVTQWDRLTEK